MNKYKCFFRSRNTEVEANTTYEAQKLAAVKFGAKKTFEVSVFLIAKESEAVTHSPNILG